MTINYRRKNRATCLRRSGTASPSEISSLTVSPCLPWQILQASSPVSSKPSDAVGFPRHARAYARRSPIRWERNAESDGGGAFGCPTVIVLAVVVLVVFNPFMFMTGGELIGIELELIGWPVRLFWKAHPRYLIRAVSLFSRLPSVCRERCRANT